MNLRLTAQRKGRMPSHTEGVQLISACIHLPLRACACTSPPLTQCFKKELRDPAAPILWFKLYRGILAIPRCTRPEGLPRACHHDVKPPLLPVLLPSHHSVSKREDVPSCLLESKTHFALGVNRCLPTPKPPITLLRKS